MLPVAGRAALPVSTAEMTAMSAGTSATDMSSTDMSVADDMADCCPRHANPCDKSAGDCDCMAACAFGCFGFVATESYVILYPSAVAGIAPALATNPYRSQPRSPPFRPPRA
jgi:hypothetical protein